VEAGPAAVSAWAPWRGPRRNSPTWPPTLRRRATHTVWSTTLLGPFETSRTATAAHDRPRPKSVRGGTGCPRWLLGLAASDIAATIDFIVHLHLSAAINEIVIRPHGKPCDQRRQDI
jgi:hypothetical protein